MDEKAQRRPLDDGDREVWAALDGDMTLEEAVAWHLLAADAGIEPEPVDVEAVLMGVG